MNINFEIRKSIKIIRKNINLWLFFLIIALFSSCTNTNHSEINDYKLVLLKDSIRNILNNKSLVDSLLYEALQNKNFNAYNKVYSSYLWKYKDRELLYYSFIMANEHNCPQACFNIFYSLTFPKNDSVGLTSIDKTTKNLALHYLLKSYELGHKDSKYTIEEIFGVNKKIPKSSEY